MSCKKVVKNIVIPQELIDGMTPFSPKFASAGVIKWQNYELTKLTGGTMIPVICKFPLNKKPLAGVIYTVVADWLKGESAISERGRKTLDHWQLTFYTRPKPEEDEPEPVAEYTLHYLIHNHDQVPGFKKGSAPENNMVIRFNGVEKRGLLYFMPVNIEPESQLFLATMETIWEGSVVTQFAGEEADMAGGIRITVLDAEEKELVIYDKRRNRGQVAICRHTRRVVGENIRSYEYLTLYDINGETDVEAIDHMLTNDGVVEMSEVETL